MPLETDNFKMHMIQANVQNIIIKPTVRSSIIEKLSCLNGNAMTSVKCHKFIELAYFHLGYVFVQHTCIILKVSIIVLKQFN